MWKLYLQYTPIGNDLLVWKIPDQMGHIPANRGGFYAQLRTKIKFEKWRIAVLLFMY